MHFSRHISAGFRKAAVAAALMTGFGAPLAAQSSQSSTARAAVTQSDSLRQTINQRLIAQAQADFTERGKFAETSYSRELDSLQARLNRDQPDGQTRDQVIVLSPDKYDAARSLGISQEIYFMKVHGVLPPYPVLAGVDNAILQNEPAMYGSAQTALQPATSPSSYDLNTGTCTIIPAQTNAMSRYIYGYAGFSPELHARLINAHESWHCRYDVEKERLMEIKQILNMMPSMPESMYLQHPIAAEGMYMMHKGETFADLGAAGDMIQQGMTTEIIEQLAAYRNRMWYHRYQTMPALNALKAHIDSTGIDAFRALSTQDKSDLYIRITDQNALTPTVYLSFLEYFHTDPDERSVLDQMAPTNPGLAAGIAHYKKYFDGTSPVPDVSILFGRFNGRDAAADSSAISSWDALAALQDRAFENAGKITPATVIDAYATMQDEFRIEMQNDETSPVPYSMALQLRRTFIQNLISMDYAALNEARGVPLKLEGDSVTPLLPQPRR